MLEHNKKIIILENNIFNQRIPRNWIKWSFFQVVRKLDNKFFQNFLHNKSLFHLLYSCANLIRAKILIHGIWAKRILANQIAEFSNQLHL